MRGLVTLVALASAAAEGPFAPLCGDAAKCGAARGSRKPEEATEPLTKTGAWGFSYGPNPLKTVGNFPNDDVMSGFMRGEWAWDGRDDLGVMAAMGAKVVRLYGNDPRWSSKDFFGEANTWGMKVIPGISDWPYIQSPDHCVREGGYDCFKNIKEAYGALLTTGEWLLGEKGKDLHYHPALDTVILTNEPELKIREGPAGDKRLPKDYMKVVLSAFDGLLAAEEERGLDITSDSAVKITVAWSYGVCPECPSQMKLKELLGCCLPCVKPEECEKWGPQGKPGDEGMLCPAVRKPNSADDCPALAQVMDLYTAIEDPSSVGYTFKNAKYKEAFEKRWVHSVNAFVQAHVLEEQFMQKYVKLPFNAGKKKSEMVPFFMGEYGDPNLAPAKMETDLKAMVNFVKGDTYPLFAFNFFQFQVAYWKPCQPEEEKLWEQWYATHWADPTWPLPTQCSERNYGTFALGDILVSKTGAVPDSWEEFPIPCIKPIFKGKPEVIAEAFGGKAPDTSLCEKGWQAKPAKFCVAARGNLDKIGETVGDVCKKLSEQEATDCKAGIPPVCEDDVEGKADWIFSSFYAVTKDDDSCDINRGMVLTAMPTRRECVADAGAPPQKGTTMTTTATMPSKPSPEPPAEPEGSFFSKNKWLIIGGGIVAAGVGVGVGLACSRQGPARAPSIGAPQGVEMS